MSDDFLVCAGRQRQVKLEFFTSRGGRIRIKTNFGREKSRGFSEARTYMFKQMALFDTREDPMKYVGRRWLAKRLAPTLPISSQTCQAAKAVAIPRKYTSEETSLCSRLGPSGEGKACHCSRCEQGTEWSANGDQLIIRFIKMFHVVVASC